MSSVNETAIGYVRVSTDKQELSPEAQRGTIKQWCAAQGIELLEVFTERISAAKPLTHRIALLDAVSAVSEHKAAHLVSVARDRLGRNTIDMAMIEKMVTEVGAKISTTDGASSADGPEGRMICQILDAVAQYERVQIGTRTRRVMRQKRARGEKFNSQAPFGMKIDGDRLVMNESEQATIARVVQLRKKGTSWRAICKTLTAEGYEPRGKKWHPTTVRRICDALEMNE